MKYIVLVVASLFVFQSAKTQTVFAFTSATNRKLHDLKLRDSIIIYRLQNFSDPVNEEQLKGTFWAMEIMLFRNAFTDEKIKTIWKGVNSFSESFQKSLLELTYTLYPSHFKNEVVRLLQSTPSPAIFVRSAEYLLKFAKQDSALIEKVLTKFDSSTALIRTLKQRLRTQKTFLNPSQLQLLFSPDFLAGETVIFSLQRANRNYPGAVIIRDGNGKFVKENGKLFSVPQLARAITDYPFYITNGNTPQGIYKWTGFDSSSNSYIGPTTNLQMVMPFEAEPAVFFPDSNTRWSRKLYASLLPLSLQQHPALYESFTAGEIGRSEIIMHGTTINPNYYAGKTYYPNTPSMGCLCSYEDWSTAGTLKKTNQIRIVNVLKQTKVQSGYVVVIELNDNPAPVTQNELNRLLKSRL